MERIIIYRFCKHPVICLNRLLLIKKFNPGVKIHGIYGGDEKGFSKFSKFLGKHLESIFLIKDKSSEWKWKHFDLVLRDWYIEIGNQLEFDTAVMIEWDIIMLSGLEDIYSKISKGNIGITGLIPLTEIEDRWCWTSITKYRKEWLSLLEFVTDKYNYTMRPNASLGPGLCLPKSFLESYSKMEIPELCHDELRIPLFAQILNYQCVDTGFYKKWFDKEEANFFNCNNLDISKEIIKSELRSGGRNVFHPFRNLYKDINQ